MAAEQSLHDPLLHKTTSTTKDSASAESPSNLGILFRLCSVILLLAISLWANREASKGFGISIINDAKDSPSGRKFALFFQSDDSATRILVNTSTFVEKFLYDGIPHPHQKLVTHVVIHFSGNNSLGGQRIPVASGTKNGDFVINISLSLMEDRNFRHRVTSVLQHSMVKIWVWAEANPGAPPELVDGTVEYIASAGGFGGENSSEPSDRILSRLEPMEGPHGCWADKDPRIVAKFLGYCEGLSKGFIQRLNEAMRQPWDDRTVDIAFGTGSWGACDSYRDMLDGLIKMQNKTIMEGQT